MANINTYAKLIKPKQFRPNEEVRIRMEYSQNLLCCYATLVINGYTAVINDNIYNGVKITQYINESILETGIVEFVIPPNTLAELPIGEYNYTGKVRAKVEIGKELNAEGNAIPQVYSNEILLDLLMYVESDFTIENTPLKATASNYDITIKYFMRYDFGTYGSTDMNSYRVFLYDENYNIVSDSGEIYNAQFVLYKYRTHTLEGLKDNTKYFVRVKGNLVGGYVIWTDYVPLTVKYEDVPTISSKLLLTNNSTLGCVKVILNEELQHDRVVISRTELNRDDYLEVASLPNSNSMIIYEDYYALPKTTYVYKAVSYNKNEIVGTYYNIVTHSLDGVVIADAYGHYTALSYKNIYPINRNDRFGFLTPMDRKTPIGVCNGLSNYDSGSVNGLFSEIKDECNIEYEDNTIFATAMRDWLNNGRAKLLKYHTGDCWIVGVNGVNDDDTENNSLVYTSFNWTEIANAKDNLAYKKEGLIFIYE